MKADSVVVVADGSGGVDNEMKTRCSDSAYRSIYASGPVCLDAIFGSSGADESGTSVGGSGGDSKV